MGGRERAWEIMQEKKDELKVHLNLSEATFTIEFCLMTLTDHKNGTPSETMRPRLVITLYHNTLLINHDNGSAISPE